MGALPGVALLLLLFATAVSTRAVPTSAANVVPSVRVVGNRLVDGSGRTVRLIGINHGAVSSCIHGQSIFDGPDPDPATQPAGIRAMTTWGVNAVRVPLNEDCWLGINGVDPALSGANYRQAIAGYVANLNRGGMAAILDLHWNGPANFPATEQLSMADADHSPEFWRSVATAFKTDPGVIFDLYNEPFIDANNTTADPWTCWRDGCTIKKGYAEGDPTGGPGFDWHSAGMQSLIDAVRSTGANQPVMLGGLFDANDLSGWLAHRPTDPAGQMAASFHNYQGQPCADAACWDTQVLPVAQVVPVVTGEFGGNDTAAACTTEFINTYMAWADAHGISYFAWAWFVRTEFDPASCYSIITDYLTAASTAPYGQAIKDHFLAVTAAAPDADLAVRGMPADITVAATGPAGAAVTYTLPTATDEEAGPTVACDHVPGSRFPLGVTKVTCTATDTDDSNSPVSANFTVTVTATTPCRPPHGVISGNLYRLGVALRWPDIVHLAESLCASGL